MQDYHHKQIDFFSLNLQIKLKCDAQSLLLLAEKMNYSPFEQIFFVALIKFRSEVLFAKCKINNPLCWELEQIISLFCKKEEESEIFNKSEKKV